MRALHAAALAMIWLVVMIPVAFAQQLTVQKFSGSDNVSGFAKENDELTIQVLAEMLGNPTPAVARQRALVYYGDTYTFMDSCTAQAQAMQQCTYKTRDLVYGGSDDYTIKLLDSANKEIASVSKVLTVDILAPKIVSFGISPNMSTKPLPTTITYKVEDYGYETGKTTGCSGIKLLNITANNTEIAQIASSVGNCSRTGTFAFTPQITGQSGRLSICAVATDHVNHKSAPVCRDILIDSRKPSAEVFELRDKEGYPIAYARSQQPIAADVFVKISDVDVNPSTVYADLSKLNPSLGRRPKDSQSGEWFIWRNIAVSSPSTCQITVNASDMMGNKETKTLTCTIGIDDTPPEPVAMGTLFVDEAGNALLGVNGTIFAEFKEAGSGLSKGNAFLDLRSLGLNAEAKADICEKSGTDSWKCLWSVKPSVNSGTYAVRIIPTTRDNINNQVSKTMQLNVTFDKTAPEGVRLAEIAAFRGQQRIKTNVTSLGETIEFVVEGAGFTEVFADLTDLGGAKNTLPERCEGNATKKQCVFSITTAVSGPQQTKVSFEFKDAAGNKAELSTSELFILGISNETAPNYWSVSTECSPELLDRATLSVFEHPVYCRIKMASTNKNAVPISVEGPADFSECTGNTEYVNEFRVENNYAGSTEPYAVMGLVAGDYNVNNLTVSCPLSILTRVGNFIPQNFEHDNATITLRFYNMPLGDLYNSIEDDIDDAKNRLEGAWKTIGKLEKYMSYAEKICTIANSIMSIISTIAIILSFISGAEAVVRAIPIVGPAIAQGMVGTQNAICSPNESLRKMYDTEILRWVQKFCNFLTCQSGLLDLFGVDTTDYRNYVNAYIGGFGLADAIGAGQVSTYTPGQDVPIQDPYTYFNIRESLVFSIAIPPLCLPGIIHNIDKWRQIECRYGLCMLEDFRENGMPVSVCSDQKHYMECRFITGEIFNLIPFAPLLSFFLNMLKEVLSNPLALVGAALSIVCGLACKAQQMPGLLYNMCAGARIVSELGRTVNIIKSFQSIADVGLVSDTWCEEFEDKLDEYEAEKAT
ncbi:MAG: hypothetical protein QXM31_02735 [Candidatus Woesearchaeota archaeon]